MIKIQVNNNDYRIIEMNCLCFQTSVFFLEKNYILIIHYYYLKFHFQFIKFRNRSSKRIQDKTTFMPPIYLQSGRFPYSVLDRRFCIQIQHLLKQWYLTPIEPFIFQGKTTYILFEAASGYSLYEVLEKEEIAGLSTQVVFTGWLLMIRFKRVFLTFQSSTNLFALRLLS